LKTGKQKFQDERATGELNRYDFIALREAQCIVRDREIQIKKLQTALREAQNIVWEREPKMQTLEKALIETQAIVRLKDRQILEQDKILEKPLKVYRVYERLKQLIKNSLHL
jgi:hypothetical protein